ncbi:MAG TPA: hypothetical protein VEV83_10005, partial [Parafilimonas sp.]|nr:hypothetical protein [Parafilimonas sp.]
GTTPDQLKVIVAAIDDLVNRIKTNKDCADLLGGQEKALKALRDSTISVEPLKAEVIIPTSGSRAGQMIFGRVIVGETAGKTIKLGSNTIFAPDGRISAINIATGQPVEVLTKPADINEVGETLAHETAHRTKSKGIIQDDNNQTNNDENNARVRKACGYN